MASVNLQMPRNWSRWTDEELREAITRLEKQVRNNGWNAGSALDYLHRLDKARLAVMRNELDRRIARRSV